MLNNYFLEGVFYEKHYILHFIRLYFCDFWIFYCFITKGRLQKNMLDASYRNSSILDTFGNFLNNVFQNVALAPLFFYPILPSSSKLIRLFISTAYSTGNSLEIGYANPLTIRPKASSSDNPLLIK